MSAAELRHLAADLAAAADTIGQRAGLVVAKTTLDIRTDAMILAPVDTGNLRNSYTATVTGLRGEVGPTAAYAPFVELGTSRMAAQPSLGPATDRRTPGFYAAMEQLAADAAGGG